MSKMSLNVQVQLKERTDRVKAIDLHPSLPWVLATLYSGHVKIWSLETQQTVKTFQPAPVPVRAGRFVARMNWIVCGADDCNLTVINYNTLATVKQFQAHPDYIRAIAVHPTLPYVLSAADDCVIKLWDWSKDWECVQEFTGHEHYVMGLAFNPKDPNTFASASLDKTVSVWNLGRRTPNFSIPSTKKRIDYDDDSRKHGKAEFHEKGINHVEFCPYSKNPYLLTASDDKTVKIWSLLDGNALVATLEGHTHNVSFACYHPTLPIIISGSEDGTVKTWNSVTYELEQTLTFNLERAWCVCCREDTQNLAVGFDDGFVVMNLGSEEFSPPPAAITPLGKLYWADGREVQLARVNVSDPSLKDDAPISLQARPIGTADFPLQTLSVSPDTKNVAVCGRGSWHVGTSTDFRTISGSHGHGLDFVWANKQYSDHFATRTGAYVNVFRGFPEISAAVHEPDQPDPNAETLNLHFKADRLSGGVLLGVRGAGGVSFFDWETGMVVRRIEVEPRAVYWSANGKLVALACERTFYVLRFSRENYDNAVAEGYTEEMQEEGVEAAFDLVAEINESVWSGQWVGDFFYFTNSNSRLKYLAGSQVVTVSAFSKPMWIVGVVGYVEQFESKAEKKTDSKGRAVREKRVIKGRKKAAAAGDDEDQEDEGADNKGRAVRIFLSDMRVGNVTSFALSQPVLDYQTLVLREQMDDAAEQLLKVPKDQLNKVARFLDGQGHQHLALEITTDPDHKLDLALTLGVTDLAVELARQAGDERKWKKIGDTALTGWDVGLATECFKNGGDLASMLLVYTSTSDRAGLADLAEKAAGAGQANVAFTCRWLLGDVEGCVDVLTKAGRLAEAVFFAQTYKPSLAPAAAQRWRESLEKGKRGRIARMLATPEDDAELFPEWEEWMRREAEGLSIEDGDATPTAAANGKAAVAAESEEPAEEAAAAAEAGEEMETEA